MSTSILVSRPCPHKCSVSTWKTQCPSALCWRCDSPARVLRRHVRSTSRPAVNQTHSSQASWARAGSDERDPGKWEYAPEWWGTQAGGWGRDSGSPVFMQQSELGNDLVSVTSHPASVPPGAADSEQHEWRVLRFNETRQSVSRVILHPASSVPDAQADCLAFGYIKTMASAAAAIINLMGKLDACLSAASSHAQPHDYASEGSCHPSQSEAAAHDMQPTTALCIGLGGGTLPNFLSHRFPGMLVDAVELDPVVIAAATSSMGLPRSRHNMRLHEGDAAEYVLQLASRVRQGQAAPLDLAFIDAFDGNDDVPSVFCSPDSVVLDALAAALHPEHGSIVMNLHGGGMPASSALMAKLFGWLPTAAKHAHSGYHTGTEQGRAVVQTTAALRDKLLGNSSQQQDGCAFTLSVAFQSNIAVVVSRALRGSDQRSLSDILAAAAQEAGGRAGYLFDAGRRAQRGITFV